MTNKTAQHIELPARRALRVAGWANLAIAAAHVIGLIWAWSMFRAVGIEEDMLELARQRAALPLWGHQRATRRRQRADRVRCDRPVHRPVLRLRRSRAAPPEHSGCRSRCSRQRGLRFKLLERFGRSTAFVLTGLAFGAA